MLIEVFKKVLQRKNKPQQQTNILAELMSKEKREASPQNTGVLPTLARSYGKPGKGPARSYRYLPVAIMSLAIVALGIGVILYAARLKVPARPQAVLRPLPQPPRPLLQQLSSSSQLQHQEPPPAMPPAVVTPVPEAAVAAVASSRTTTKAVAIPAKRVKKVQHKMTPLRGRTTNGTAISKVVAMNNQPGTAGTVAPGGSVQTGREDNARPKVDTAASGALLYAARSAEQAGDWRQALDSYRRALIIDPGNYLIMSNIAVALNNLGMYREGVQQAENALARKQDYVPAMINAAIAHSSLGETVEALRYFAAASSADPGNISLAVNLGIYQERIGRFDDALATYAKPAAAGEPHAQEGMGRIYERQGNRNEAIAAYRLIVANRNASMTLKKKVQERLMRLEQ